MDTQQSPEEMGEDATLFFRGLLVLSIYTAAAVIGLFGSTGLALGMSGIGFLLSVLSLLEVIRLRRSV